MDVGLQLDELVGLEIPLLGEERFPFWVPVLHHEADVEGDLSKAVTVQILLSGEVGHAVYRLSDVALFMGCKGGLLPLLFLSL